MIRIYNDKNNKRSHIALKKLFHKYLKKYQKLLPDFKIVIYDDYDYITSPSTAIYREENRIDFNIAQIFHLYKNPQDISRIKTDHIEKINSFKKYIIFVLYHELGHFKSKKYFANKYSRNIEELRADYFSLRIIKKLFS